MSKNCKIISLNCRGLQDSKKRKDVFRFLREKKSSIVCLQDTHFTSKDINYVRSQWGYHAIFSPGKSDSRGVAILFNNNFEFKITKEKIDGDGNLLAIEITIENRYTITLISIYEPNKDSPDFFRIIQNIINEFESEFIIICGDWNLVQDFDKDCLNYATLNNPKSKEIVKKLKEDFNLVDPWRIQNPDTKRYTWFRSSPVKKARLDFFLISNELMSVLDKVDISPGYRTDHSIIELEYRTSNLKIGKGFWRFNNSLLRDPEYVNKVKDTILEVKKEYAVPVYMQAKISDIPDEELYLTIDDNLFLEMLHMKIRQITIPYCSQKKKERNNRKNSISLQIQILQEINDQNHSDLLTEVLHDLNMQLEEIRKYELNGILIRTRAKWIEDGEKPSKYFCSLEKRNFVNKSINKLVCSSGRELYHQDEILTEIKLFYANLYRSRDDELEDIDLQNLLGQYDVSKLSEDQKSKLDLDISKEEILSTLKNMKNDKTPGTDGFSAEFYKFFWKDLGNFLLRAYRCSYEKQELAHSQKLGIITVLPKGDKPREYLKNWRPISLLNVSYKVLAGVLANRMKSVLDTIIHNDQTGFIAGRYMCDNTRLLYDIMHFTSCKDIPGLILLIDFEKAFDSVSWRFLKTVLDFFNFGEVFKKWINIILNEAKLCVIQNGIFSDFFKIGRGCRQGDPISPYLFILCVEIMGIMIRNDKSVKGITIKNKKYTLSQYADDTAILLDGSGNSLSSALTLVNQFSKFSGLLPNYDKTKCIWIGSKKYSKDRLRAGFNLNWTTDPFTVLGVTFCNDMAYIIDMNYKKKIDEIKKLLSHWSRRNLSTMGKIAVVKTLLLPILTHLFISLPSPGKNITKEIERLFFNFIWNSKKDRIARKTLIHNYDMGGLKMINIDAFIKSLKMTWIRRILSGESIWRGLTYDTMPSRLSNILNMGSYNIKLLTAETCNPFWKEVFNALYEFVNLVTDDFLFAPIWLNHDIKIDGKPVSYQSWFDRGVRYVFDFIDETGFLINYERFCNKYNFRPPFTLYNGLQQSIGSTKKHFNYIESIKNNPWCPNYFQVIQNSKKGSKDFYEVFIKDMYVRPSSESKWEHILDFQQSEIWWRKCNSQIATTTNDIKLRWFQYRILHRILSTNSYLHKIGISDSNLCTFCNGVPESMYHLFVDCRYVLVFWENLFLWMNRTLGTDFEYNKLDIIFGKVENNYEILNLIILLAKYHIYRQKIKKSVPSFEGLKKEIIYYRNLQEFIYRKNCRYEVFQRKWDTFLNL